MFDMPLKPTKPTRITPFQWGLTLQQGIQSVIIWFQIFLSNIYIIFLQFYMTHGWDSNRYSDTKCCIAMNNYTYTYACRNITTSGHSSLEKYTSHFIERIRKSYKGYYCVRGKLETEQNCNILTPTLMAIKAFFFSRSSGLLNRGPSGPASAGTWFSFQHLLSDWSELQLPDFLSHPGL